MTEENKDSTPAKLRLTPKPKDHKAEAQSGEGNEPKPDLKLKRPSERPQSPVSEAPKPEAPKPVNSPAEEPTPPIERPTQAEKPSVQPTDERPFDPENPFAGIDIKKPNTESADRPPPELPSKPAPSQKDGSVRKVEEAIDRIGDEKKNHAILTSLIVIGILIAILGGAGYGLYYILNSPAETTAADSRPEQQTAAEDNGEDSEGLLSGPIAKAKATIATIPDSGDWQEEKEEATSIVAEKTVEQELSNHEPEAAGTSVRDSEASPPPMDSSKTDSISEFLQNAHIAGVRTGDRPKLILNGKNYNKGDLIDPDKGLRFIGIREKKLAFRDARGVVYIKSF